MIATAQAPQTASTQVAATARATGIASRFDADDVPSMDAIRNGETCKKAKSLDDKALSEVLRGVRDFDLGDDKSLTDFGVERMKSASKLSSKAVDLTRKSDLEAIEKITLAMTEKQRELRLGDLKPRFLDRFLPTAAAKRVREVLRIHDDINESVRDSLKALAEEKRKLSLYRTEAKTNGEQTNQTIEGLDRDIAVLEIAREALQKRLAKFIEANKDKMAEEATAQKMKDFDLAQAQLERQMNFLVNSRGEAFTALETYRNFGATYNVLIQAADAQVAFNTQAFDNTVAILSHAARQKNVINAIDSQREAAGEWIHARGDAAVKTVENTMRILKIGVLELDKMTEAFDRAEEANLKLIQGCKSAKQELFEMTNKIIERAAQASARTTQAALSSNEEVTGMINELAGARLPGRPN